MANRPMHFLAGIAAALACGLAGAAPIAFVHSDGRDTNTRHDCDSTHPCRTFAAALAVVDPGGELVAMDSADFGTVGISRSVTISGGGNAAIIASTPAAIGVIIEAPGIDVVLRGLVIDGLGNGLGGIAVKSARSLTVENCVVANFAGQGILVTTPGNLRVVGSEVRGNANGARLQGGSSTEIVKSRFTGNRGAGVLLLADTAGTTSAIVADTLASGGSSGFDAGASHPAGFGRMVVTGSVASHNATGFIASASAGNAVLTVGQSSASRNGIGFAHFPGVAGTATFESMGDNVVRQNTTATAGIIVPVPPM